jgi:DNA repair photolyase
MASGVKGRGAAHNPRNRFEIFDVEREEPPPERVDTQLIADHSRTILSKNSSPDVPFDRSINPYRGCEHGCAYCYARPSHEYLGFSAGLDFETKIMVKHDAAKLLRQELMKPRYKPQVVALSGVTDCYQPLERKLRITRQVLEVLTEFRNPVQIITKNHLVTRDVDLLSELARHNAVSVAVSINSLDVELVRKMEPRTSSPRRRLQAIEELTAAGVPCGVLVAPVVPAINDHEISNVVAAAAEAGARSAGFVMLRLPLGVAPLFEEWLGRAYPERKDKVLHRIEELRGGERGGGKRNSAKFGERMRGVGAFAEQTKAMFELACRRAGLESGERGRVPLEVGSFRRRGEQMSLGL